MGKRKTLNELTIKDNFMFAAVMSDPANCQPLLEMILEIPIDHVEVSLEKCIIYNPQYHGIRLDVYAKDSKGSHYDIEMQVKKDPVLKRSRYYHSQMDMEYLTTNSGYSELPDSYVIFICDFDPFGCGRFKYTQVSHFKEEPDYYVDDGIHSIYLSTKGQNTDEVSTSLINFLQFVHATLDDSCNNFNDPFVDQLRNAVTKVKASREMGNRFMSFEELLQDEREEGREEGRAECLNQLKDTLITILKSKGSNVNQVTDDIRAIDDFEQLSQLMIIAANSSSLEEFLSEYKK